MAITVLDALGHSDQQSAENALRAFITRHPRRELLDAATRAADRVHGRHH